MFENKTEAEARKEILDLVAEYADKFHNQKKEFHEGDRIPYASRVYDSKEMVKLVDSSLEFWLTSGRYTDEFEKKLAEYLHVRYCALVNSGSSANLVAFMTLTSPLLGDRRVKRGDEIITVAAGFPTTVTPAIQYGAVPVFVDVTIPQYNIDADKLEAALSEKTKAVIPVDLAGIMCDYDKIFEIVEAKKSLFHPANELQEKFGRVIVVADAAHAFGAERKGKKCGQAADFTSFSFHAVKNLTTAEGGAVTWRPIEGVDDDEIYKKYMLFSLHGQSKDALAKTQLGAWEYDVVAPYFKCNMTDIMASIGLVQLKRYDALLARRREIIGMYDKALESLPVNVLNHFDTDHKSSGHLYLIRVQGKTREECNEIITKMAEHGVATNVHYKPLPLLSAYKNMGFDIKDYPNAYDLFENAITLPLHTKLTDEEVKYVTDVLKECIG